MLSKCITVFNDRFHFIERHKLLIEYQFVICNLDIDKKIDMAFLELALIDIGSTPINTEFTGPDTSSSRNVEVLYNITYPVWKCSLVGDSLN